MIKRLRLYSLFFLALGLCGFSQTLLADPVTYVFSSSSLDGNTTLDGSQFTLTVSDQGSGNVGFTFSNLGPFASYISEIYWHDALDLLGSYVSLPSGWSSTAHPSHLPGGDSSTGYWDPQADIANHRAAGIDPSESETFVLSLSGSNTLAQIISAIDSGDLLVGIHVRGIDPRLVVSSDSDAFLLQGRRDVPEPTTMLLLVAGLIVVGLLSHYKLGMGA